MAETIRERCFITKRQTFTDPPPGWLGIEFTSADGMSRRYMYEHVQAGVHRFVVGDEPPAEPGETARWVWYTGEERLNDDDPRFDTRAECIAYAWNKVMDTRPVCLFVHTVGATTVWCLDMSGGKHVLHRREVEQGWEVSHG